MGERKREGSMWVMAEDKKEKRKRQSFCLTSSGAKVGHSGKAKGKAQSKAN